MAGAVNLLKKGKLLVGVAVFALGFGLVVTWNQKRVEADRELREDLEDRVDIGTAAEVAALLDRGGDPNMRDIKYEDVGPRGFLEWVRSLFGRRPDYGETLIEKAMMNQSHRFEVAKLLLDRGANLHPIPPMGHPILFVPTRDGDLATTKLLVEHGADVNDHEPMWRPLDGAIMAEDPKIVRYLLDHGADASQVGDWSKFMDPFGPKDPKPSKAAAEIRKMLVAAGMKPAGSSGARK